MPFRGHNQSAGWGPKNSLVPQRDLVRVLRALIDASRGKAASKTRDDARAALREVMAIANWNTPFVLRSIGAKRCRYLLGLGYPVPAEPATRTSVDRLTQWSNRGR